MKVYSDLNIKLEQKDKYGSLVGLHSYCSAHQAIISTELLMKQALKKFRFREYLELRRNRNNLKSYMVTVVLTKSISEVSKDIDVNI